MTYFSEREQGERPREFEEISEAAWGGIQALIRGRIEDGSFGASFPETCSDGVGTVGTDETSFWQAVRAEIPGFEERPWHGVQDEPPARLDILDLSEFCCQSVGKPIQGGYHSFLKHHHLSFDIEAGRDEFRERVNWIFRRNGLVYELKDNGHIERIAPLGLREALMSAEFRTGDTELDAMFEKARRKFLDPDISVRREALEALWDAWERLKTLDGPDKKAQVAALLDATASPSSPKLRDAQRSCAPSRGSVRLPRLCFALTCPSSAAAARSRQRPWPALPPAAATPTCASSTSG